MKKLLLGMVIGSLITGAVFYYINMQNENQERENIKEFLASFRDAKTTQEKLDEALNDPKAALVLSSALTVVIAKDELFYYRGTDCGKLARTDIINVRGILSSEKQHTTSDKLMIIIKKTKEATLRNSMDLLDAITNSGITPGHFAEAAMTENEKNCIQNYKQH